MWHCVRDMPAGVRAYVPGGECCLWGMGYRGKGKYTALETNSPHFSACLTKPVMPAVGKEGFSLGSAPVQAMSDTEHAFSVRCSENRDAAVEERYMDWPPGGSSPHCHTSQDAPLSSWGHCPGLWSPPPRPTPLLPVPRSLITEVCAVMQALRGELNNSCFIRINSKPLKFGARMD